MIPQGNKDNTDLVDVLTQSATKTIMVTDKDGGETYEQILDAEIFWWKTLDVSSEHFSRLAYELKEFERLGDMAFNAMPYERAMQFKKDILSISESYRRAIDAKGSESRINKHHAKQTNFDKVGKNKIERVYTTKGAKVKGSLADIFAGKQRDDDMVED